jgi:hypothetical protein
MPTEAQTIKELQDFTVRLQKQINELKEQVNSTALDDTEPEDTLESRVWEAVLSSVISNMLNPSQIMPTDPNVQQKMMTRALHLADKWVEAARLYKQEKEIQKAKAPIDPIKELLDK